MAIYKDVEDLLGYLPTTRLTDSREWTSGYNAGWYDLRSKLASLPTEDYGTIHNKINNQRAREINFTVQWMKDFCDCAEENGFTHEEAVRLVCSLYEKRRR